MTIYSVKKQIEASLGPDVRSRRTELPLDDYQVVLDDSLSIDSELVENLLTYALQQEMEKERELDQWLAPRVHFALRNPQTNRRGPWILDLVDHQSGPVLYHASLGNWRPCDDVSLHWRVQQKRPGGSLLVCRMARNGPSLRKSGTFSETPPLLNMPWS